MGRQKMAVTHVVRLLVLFMLVGVVDSMIRSVHPLPSWFTDFFSKRQAEDVAVMFAAQATKHIAPSTAVQATMQFIQQQLKSILIALAYFLLAHAWTTLMGLYTDLMRTLNKWPIGHATTFKFSTIQSTLEDAAANQCPLDTMHNTSNETTATPPGATTATPPGGTPADMNLIWWCFSTCTGFALRRLENILRFCLDFVYSTWLYGIIVQVFHFVVFILVILPSLFIFCYYGLAYQLVQMLVGLVRMLVNGLLHLGTRVQSMLRKGASEEQQTARTATAAAVVPSARTHSPNDTTELANYYLDNPLFPPAPPQVHNSYA